MKATSYAPGQVPTLLVEQEDRSFHKPLSRQSSVCPNLSRGCHNPSRRDHDREGDISGKQLVFDKSISKTEQYQKKESKCRWEVEEDV